MPAGIRGPEAEKSWDRAKAAAKEQYPGLEAKNKDRFYAIVMTIYKSMCKNKACSPKKEGMSDILNRIELVESKVAIPKDYRGWLLHEPVDRASADLTRKAIGLLRSAVINAAKELEAGMKDRANGGGKNFDSEVEGKALSDAWGKHVKPVLDDKRYDSVGFGEPEPRVIAGQKLIDAIKGFYGIKGWTDLGDYIF